MNQICPNLQHRFTLAEIALLLGYVFLTAT